MEYIPYQRPREKLRERGISALSTVELVQILIGSGTKAASAARIAKNVTPLLGASSLPLYDDLIKIPGLGGAKVAQLIAACELGLRLRSSNDRIETEAMVSMECKLSPKRMLEYVAVGGNGKILCHKTCLIPTYTAASVAIKVMVAEALSTRASLLSVAIGCRTLKIDTLDSEMLRMLKLIFDTALLLEIKLSSVLLVNQSSQHAFKRKELQ